MTIIAPHKPHPTLKEDTKLIVWDKEYPLDRHKRYFAFFKDNLVCCFEGGLTSWSTENYDDVESWDFYEVVISMPKDIAVNKKLEAKSYDFDKIYQEYSEGKPVSILSMRYDIPEKKLRKWLEDY